jgi:ribonuclease J
VPLGGLGEIGMNCLALEQADGILIIDCGVNFPDDDRGVDVLHPSFRYLEERADRISGLFLTHGHEDHVGAISFLLARFKIPVWGPRHALKIAERRVRERFRRYPPLAMDFRTALPGQAYRVGPFEVEPVRVSHSIVEATALAIKTAGGTIVHTGDFKFDPNPPDGEPTDEKRLEEIGDAGVELLLSDSTNVGTPHGASSGAHSEAVVADTLEALIQRARQRVLVGLFSSNVQRLISLGAIAERNGRRIVLMGRSLRGHVETAQELGHLRWESNLRATDAELATLPPGEVLVLAGGTQAEAGSALTRIAAASHPAFSLSAGDSVILSCRVIPGNERRVSHMYNQILRQDVELFTRSNEPNVHTSGHASRAELCRMMELTRPRCFVPLHGTRQHLEEHAKLAKSQGIDECAVIENGEVLELADGRLTPWGHVHASKVAIDLGYEPLDEDVLSERTQLARTGTLHVAVVLDAAGALAAPPQLSPWGLATFESFEQRRRLTTETEQLLRKQSKRWLARGLEPEEELARFLTWRLEQLIGRRPCVSVQVIRLDG